MGTSPNPPGGRRARAPEPKASRPPGSPGWPGSPGSPQVGRPPDRGAVGSGGRFAVALVYLLVAGTYTPISLLALGRGLAIAVLTGIWAAAAAGAALVLAHGNVRGVGFAIYMLLGWPGIVVLPFAAPRLHLTGVLLVVAGGVIYTIGAVMLIRRRPDPNPAVFGYHEVWHALTIVAAACHWTVIWMLVRAVWPS